MFFIVYFYADRAVSFIFFHNGFFYRSLYYRTIPLHRVIRTKPDDACQPSDYETLLFIYRVYRRLFATTRVRQTNRCGLDKFFFHTYVYTRNFRFFLSVVLHMLRRARAYLSANHKKKKS